MRRKRDPYPRPYELAEHGEPTLRYLAEMHAKNAKEHDRQARLERELSAIYLNAAEARALEKAARKGRPNDCQTTISSRL
jgi:hypothetical protein